uniref:Uncharacterized protein n=1 Tax=Arundo donax TaxID=35708 RepID=A0A0A9CK12_ARUDO
MQFRNGGYGVIGVHLLHMHILLLPLMRCTPQGGWTNLHLMVGDWEWQFWKTQVFSPITHGTGLQLVHFWGSLFCSM